MEHTWIIEEVDGGTLGPVDIWRCSVCGAAGGPALPWQKRPWDPFIPGAGASKNISKNCVTARVEIRGYIEGRIRDLKLRLPSHAELFEDALKASTEKTDIMEMVHIISEVERTTPPLQRVREMLRADGFTI